MWYVQQHQQQLFVMVSLRCSIEYFFLSRCAFDTENTFVLGGIESDGFWSIVYWWWCFTCCPFFTFCAICLQNDFRGERGQWILVVYLLGVSNLNSDLFNSQQCFCGIRVSFFTVKIEEQKQIYLKLFRSSIQFNSRRSSRLQSPISSVTAIIVINPFAILSSTKSSQCFDAIIFHVSPKDTSAVKKKTFDMICGSFAVLSSFIIFSHPIGPNKV